MSKPTPGPWALEGRDGGGWKLVGAQEDFVAYLTESRYADERDDPIACANARLIAAAPELLASLERCRSLLAIAEGQFPPEFNARVRTAVTDARAAIAKATGAA